MLLTDSGSEHSSVDATENIATKANLSNRMNGESRNGAAKSFTEEDASSNPVEWEEVKKARNRINSQRTRERERAQIKSLEVERARLWLSNDAIKFQNRHFRELIAQIIEIRDLKRMRAGGSSNSSATLFGAGALGAGMPVSIRQDVMGGLGGGLDGELFQSTRLSAAAKNLSGLSDADLLARRQANALEMQNMMRHQEAMDRFGAGGGMGGLNMGLGSRMAGGAAGGAPGPSARGMNRNGMNINGMNINASYSDMAENIRIRKLMLQHSAAGGDFEPKGLGVGNGFGGNGGDDSMNGNGNSNGLSLGAAVGGIGNFGELNGMSDAEILHMSKRQKFGY